MSDKYDSRTQYKDKAGKIVYRMPDKYRIRFEDSKCRYCGEYEKLYDRKKAKEQINYYNDTYGVMGKKHFLGPLLKYGYAPGDSNESGYKRQYREVKQ